jgi:hypothetical protein
MLAVALLSLLAHAAAAEPPIKKSNSGICHDASSASYAAAKHFEAFQSLDECLKSGGRLPKKRIHSSVRPSEASSATKDSGSESSPENYLTDPKTLGGVLIVGGALAGLLAWSRRQQGPPNTNQTVERRYRKRGLLKTQDDAVGRRPQRPVKPQEHVVRRSAQRETVKPQENFKRRGRQRQPIQSQDDVERQRWEGNRRESESETREGSGLEPSDAEIFKRQPHRWDPWLKRVGYFERKKK